MSDASSFRLTGRMIVGGLFILVGLLFMLDNFGLVDAGDLLRFWPLILIAVGLLKLQPREGGQRAFGVALIALGIFFQLQMLAFLDWSFGDIWPAILVILGAILISRSIGRVRGSVRAFSASDLSELAFMGGVNRVINSQEFRGGEVTAVMGGVEVDMREASISGESAVIDVFALWGGIEIKVPQEWTVDVKGLPIMGGFENTTHSTVSDPALAQRLIVRGTAIMGGVEIKN